MQDYAERLRFANQTITHIERAQRQERRLQREYGEMCEAQASIDLASTGSKFAPAEWVEADQRFQDQIYFLIVALRQVVRGQELMEHYGYEMPRLRWSGLVQSWRNVEEHWDDEGRGRPIRAREAWRYESDEAEPGLSYAGNDELTDASGLAIQDVREDLAHLRKAVGRVSEMEWEHCYIRPTEAAAILGITTEELAGMKNPPRSLDFEEDLGLRYWREAVEARKEGWTTPPRWVREDWAAGPPEMQS